MAHPRVAAGFLLLIAIALASFVAFLIHNLRKNKLRNEELARSNAELQAKTARARETDERFRLMFHGNPLPTYVYDCESLRLLDMNEAAADEYGYALDEFLALSVPDIRPGTDTAAYARVAGPASRIQPCRVWRQRRKTVLYFRPK